MILWWQKQDREERLAISLLLAAMAVAAVLLILEGWGSTLLIDEWSFGYGARTNFDAAAFFAPHNGHLVLVQVLITKAYLQVFGAGSVLPLLLLSVAIHLGVVVCLYALLRGPLGSLPALAPAVLVLFLGAANDAFVGSHGMSNTIVALSGLGALLALRAERTSWDAFAAFLLTVAVCSNGSALSFCVVAIALVLLASDSTSRRRLWIPAVPLLVYAVWWLAEGRGEGQFAIANLGGLPAFAFDSFASTLAVITGLFTTPGSRVPSFELGPGQALAGACLVGLLALWLGRNYRPPRAAIPALAGLLAFWLLTAGVASPERQPLSGRYLYIGVIIFLLLLAEGIKASSLSRKGSLALASICVFALLPNIRELTYGADYFREQAEANRAVMGAADLLQGHAPGAVVLEEGEDLQEGDVPDLQFSLEAYVASRERFGSPADSVGELEEAPTEARADADRFILRALAVAVEPASGPPARLPSSVKVTKRDGALAHRGGCLRFTPSAANAALVLNLPSGGLWVRPAPGPGVSIAMRRFGDAYRAIGSAPEQRPSILRMPPGPASKAWRARLNVKQPISVCGA